MKDTERHTMAQEHTQQHVHTASTTEAKRGNLRTDNANGQGKRKRNSSVELLRFFFMAGILLIHIYGFGISPYPYHIFELGRSPETCIHLALNCLGQVGVTGFVFISGYYGIRINRRKIMLLVLTTIFYAVIIELTLNTHMTLKTGLSLLHAFDLLWFMSCYIMLCLVSPVIEAGVKSIGRHAFRNVVIGIIIYVYGAHLIGFYNDHNFLLLLSVYLIARYTSLYPPTFLIRHTKAVIAAGLFFTAAVPVIFSMCGTSCSPIMGLAATNNNIALLALSAGCIIEAERHSTHIPVVNYFSSSILSIYLITSNSLVCQPLMQYLYPTLLKGYGFALVIACCLFCLLIDKVRIFIFDIVALTAQRLCGRFNSNSK